MKRDKLKIVVDDIRYSSRRTYQPEVQSYSMFLVPKSLYISIESVPGGKVHML